MEKMHSNEGLARLCTLARHLNQEILFEKTPTVPGTGLLVYSVKGVELWVVLYPIVELIYLFPSQWERGDDRLPRLSRSPDATLIESVMSFFGLNELGFVTLFVLGGQHPRYVNGVLRENIPPREYGQLITSWLRISNNFFNEN